uniref:Molybdenum carrier n=1 Tax=Candidatus Kentrum sp. MB TaxID=2138164 RepID=A0A451BF01_9GAMM|nr:MAG: Putative molybdenum carrier [Candidatus Kentron sp. MB]VFK34613.1 MAG: Putative molybdenum carrier [Candidatus Kentron sp. MB]VFK76854.1 MAG: Putative molybdenum carrier [Candidatus Kentron sp. MB]
MLGKLISGGQTGVDQAALRAALRMGLAVGGWCPPGRICEAGEIPREFPLQETPMDRSSRAPDIPRSLRTERNVQDSEGTLILAFGSMKSLIASDRGTRWTVDCALRLGRPLYFMDIREVEAPNRIAEWIKWSDVGMVNVAGPSENTAPGIGALAFEVLLASFENRNRSGVGICPNLPSTEGRR